MNATKIARGVLMAVIASAVAVPAHAQQQPAPKPLPKCTDKKKTDCEASPKHPKDPTVRP
jgi:hypothetical protein